MHEAESGLHEWLLLAHILMVIVWVGGDVTMQLLATRAQREADPVKLAAFVARVEWAGLRVFTPASLLVLVTGILLVIQEPEWTFAQFWILAALGMFAFSFVSGAFYLGPNSAKLKKMYEAEGPNAPGAPALIGRLFLVSRVELVLLILIVFDMVFKPGL